MKKLIIILVCAILNVVGLPTITKAAGNDVKILNDEKGNDLVWHDVSDLDTLSIDQTYTYEEMVEYLSNEGYSKKEIIEEFGLSENNLERGTDVHYTLVKMKVFQYKAGLFSTYDLQVRFTVGLQYSGTNVSPDKMVSLGGAHIYTGYGELCKFAGEIYYKLVAGNEIYYSFYGDIFESGTVNWSVSAKIGIGEDASVEGNISNGNGHKYNVSESETSISAGLSKWKKIEFI